METRDILRISDWEGLNTRLADMDLPPAASPDLLNIEFFKEGWTSRNGYSKRTAAALGSDPITGLYDGFNHILEYDGSTLRKWDNASAFDVISAALASGAVPAFASYNALDLIATGSAGSAIQQWDGTNLTALGGSPPNADDIAVWHNYIFLAGLASPNQDQVRFSEFEDPQLWPAGHFLRPTKRGKGTDIVAIKVCPVPQADDGTRLVAFASDAIYHFDGFVKQLFQIYQVQRGLGAIARRGIVVAEGITYWLDENGFYASPDAGFNVNQISWNIQPTFDNLNKARLSLACAVNWRYKRQIWWSVSDTTSAYHNKILVYHYGLSTPMVPYQQGGRHVWSIYNHSLMAFTELLSGGQYFVWGGQSNAASSNGFVLILDQGNTDAGAAITWRHKTGRITNEGAWSRGNVMRKLMLMTDALPDVDIEVRHFIDMSDAVSETKQINLHTFAGIFDVSKWGNALFDSSGGSLLEVWFNQWCRASQFELLSSDLGKQFRLLEMAVERKGKLLQ